MPGLLRFEWERDADGYAIEEIEALGNPPMLWLKPQGGAAIRYRPLVEHPALFREFASLERTDEGFKAFADRYGPIRHEVRGLGKPLLDWYQEHQWMLDLVELWEGGLARGNLAPLNDAINKLDFGFISFSVRFGRAWESDHPALYIEPDDLLSAMFLQFTQAVSGNADLRRCAWCPTWFAYGTGTGRRKSAHYCSDRCRKAAHKHRKEAQQ